MNEGRKHLEFFVQKYGTSEVYSIRQLLESDFDETVIGLWDRSPTIPIHYKYMFEENRKFHCEVQLDDIWKVAEKAGNTAEVYYMYFFLMMGLTNPKVGLTETIGISYNLEKIAQVLLGDLNDLFDSNE
jgi:hypothetical protein